MISLITVSNKWEVGDQVMRLHKLNKWEIGEKNAKATALINLRPYHANSGPYHPPQCAHQAGE